MASWKDKILHVQYIFALDLHNIRQQCSGVTHLNAAVVWMPCCRVHCSPKSMDEGNNVCVAASMSLPQTSILIYTKNYTSLSTAIFCSGSTWHLSQWFISTNRTIKWVTMGHLLHMMLALCPSAMGALEVYCRRTFSLSNYTYKRQGGAPKLHTQQNTPNCMHWSAVRHTAVTTQWVLFLKIIPCTSDFTFWLPQSSTSVRE
jgi:hypothetical protein